ncbi:MAG TPA: hypothetical protein VMT82_00175, partial [candidate division Zixibacteria bacterium]|nr:hypothetical protein [candidate division Zixibacteria bacterium]
MPFASSAEGRSGRIAVEYDDRRRENGNSARTAGQIMNLYHRVSILILAAASVAACAQDLKNAPEGNPQPTTDPGMTNPQQAPQAKPLNAPGAGQQSTSNTPTPNRANAYYHFQLGHMYEEMVAMTGRVEFANQAV